MSLINLLPHDAGVSVRVERARIGPGRRSVRALHRRIVADHQRQQERRRAGRYVWPAPLPPTAGRRSGERGSAP